ncbi:hypothetical protein F4825DRAFT_419119 [Nemania diffusa]|nr:hypothetical protein F4825DRAFT_419119 [Nemania diffusa]
MSLFYWLIVGGTGPPPIKANFCRMESERKAAYRKERAKKRRLRKPTKKLEKPRVSSSKPNGRRQVPVPSEVAESGGELIGGR